jgi:hypothetical protein
MSRHPHIAPLKSSDDFESWVIQVEAVLIDKDVMSVVDRSEVRPLGAAGSKPVKAFLQKQQVARAAIILHVDKSQLAHCHDKDPAVIWEALQRVHRPTGFASLIARRRQFWEIRKAGDESMESYIARVVDAAFRLQDTAALVSEIDVIINLTQNLPPAYDPLIVALDTEYDFGSSAESSASITVRDKTDPMFGTF